MGYETRFSLDFSGDASTSTHPVSVFFEYEDLKNQPYTVLRKKFGENTAKWLEENEKIAEKIPGDVAIDLIENAYFDTLDPCKWYDHERDMKSFSKVFPGILFTLHGIGEEPNDQWYKYFKDGKMQIAKAQISFEPFDPKKLK
jgi:hypothetical protein